MRIIIIIFLTTNLAFSQIEFEEVFVADSIYIENFMVKGDSIFISSLEQKPGRNINYYFSINGGESFENVTIALTSNPFFDNYDFRNFHPSLFRFYNIKVINGDTIFGQVDVRGETTNSYKTNFYHSRLDQYLRVIPTDTNLVYFTETTCCGAPTIGASQDKIMYSTNQGRLFKKIKADKILNSSRNIIMGINIRKPTLIRAFIINWGHHGPFGETDDFLFDVKTELYDYDYPEIVYEQRLHNQWGLNKINQQYVWDQNEDFDGQISDFSLSEVKDNKHNILSNLSYEKFTGLSELSLVGKYDKSDTIRTFIQINDNPYTNYNRSKNTDLFHYNLQNPEVQALVLNFRSKNSKNSDRHITYQLLFKSYDNGNSWELVFEHNTLDGLITIEDIIINPLNNDILFITNNLNTLDIENFPYTNVSKLYREKGTNTSVENQNVDENKVYFAENGLIIESDETNRNELISIYDLSGNLLFKETKNLNKGTNEILVPQISSGLYLVMIGNKNKTYKLIKVE